MKKVLAIVLSALIIACGAACAQSVLRVNAEYEGFGFVELELSQDVNWLEPQIIVADANGCPVEAQIIRYDRDDVDFRMPDAAEDQVYTCTVSGISGGETVTCEFYAASAMSAMIRSAEYDAEDRELDIEFAMDVEYENPSVTVTDASGAQYEADIIERDNDGLEVRVTGLTSGGTYTVSVSGVRGQIFESFETYALEFVARDD